jgi:hypothetical protein
MMEILSRTLPTGEAKNSCAIQTGLDTSPENSGARDEQKGEIA